MTTPSDIRGNESAPAISTPLATRKRIVDRLDRRLVNALTVLGFCLPPVSYFWLLTRFSVNVVVGDQWNDVTVIKQSYVHFFDWGPMWVQHNESRIFFPNIVVVLLAHTTHFNIRVEEFLSAIMLVAATALLIGAHKRRSPRTPWLYYCPVAFLAFSFVQYGNTLWGFQMAWYMTLLTMAAAVFLLDRGTLTWAILLGALAVSVVGSFSSIQGLLIWPAGLVLLWYRRRSWSLVGTWIAVAIASTGLYFRNYKSASPFPHFARAHPLAALKFLLFAVGDIVGKSGAPSPENTLVVLFGLCIVLLAVGTVLICGFRRDERGGSPIGIALICFGLLFAATLTQGRSFLGYSGASISRYTTFDLVIPIGIFFALLDRHAHIVDTHPLDIGSPGPLAPNRGWRRFRGTAAWLDRITLSCARVAAIIVIAVQIPFGIHYGLQGARQWYAYDVRAVTVLRNIDQVRDGEIILYLYPLSSASFVRQQARVLEEHRLNVFAPSPAAPP